MKFPRLILRNLVYFWRTNLAVLAGVAIAVSVLSGALLVGESVRGSLRALVFQRLGASEYIVTADHFFTESLSRALASTVETDKSIATCPIIFLQGVISNAGSGTRVNNVNIYGIDERFWKFQGMMSQRFSEGRAALLGAPLADKLGVRIGGSVLLRFETQLGIPKESLYGRRENIGRTIRLVCDEILPAERLGEFSFRASQGPVYSVFVPLKLLQKDLAQPSSVNVILLGRQSTIPDLEVIRKQLKGTLTLEDAGARVRALPDGLSVESRQILLSDTIAQAAFAAAAEVGVKASGILTYLANSIRIGEREIPYSVITAADLGRGVLKVFYEPREFGRVLYMPADPDESIWLNPWAWHELGGSPGQVVEVDYYLWQEDGVLATRTARFRLAGVVSIGGDVNATLAPDFPGITEARSIAEWDPPFPLDLGRIRAADEEYWDRYKATPKAFITLKRGQDLWQSRFGKLTAVRVAPVASFGGDSSVASASRRIRPPVPLDPASMAAKICARIDPGAAGFTVSAVKEAGLEASRGSTDFGEYFTYFSFFLIAAAILLSALFFRLGVEQRTREIGTLQAMGFPMRTLQRLFLWEGGALSICGSLIGLLGSVAYGGIMVYGLRNWWIGAVGTGQLHLRVFWPNLVSGAAIGIVISLMTAAWTLRGLRRYSALALLAGMPEGGLIGKGHRRSVAAVSILTSLGAAAVLCGSALRVLPRVEGFFGSGFLMLIALLSLSDLYLRRECPKPISGRGFPALYNLAVRNAMYRPGRGTLCMALMASATFVIVSLEVFRWDPHAISLEASSGTGGYPLMAESALPVINDPNTPQGREALGIPASEVPELSSVKLVSFRVRRGDDASCLNLYAPQLPKILGAPHSFLVTARFSFQESLASTPAQKQNPWLLLEEPTPDGSIPAIADATTMEYSLHLGLRNEITVPGRDGTPTRLRLVAALKDSILQGELIISESHFLRAFPEQQGYRFFLLDVAPEKAANAARLLEDRLSDLGFNVESTGDRLAAYHAVENTYLSTFQSLGALGLVLGTAGFAAILLRNVLERRRELALLHAVGYRRGVLSGIIIAENALIMAWGLACGTIGALLAVLPVLHSRGNPFPLAKVSMVLLGVLLSGLTSSFLAVTAALRTPLLDALKSE